MIRALARLFEYIRPIPDAAVPRLAESIAHTATLACVVAITVGTLVHISEVARGRAALIPSLVLWLTLTAINTIMLAALPWRPTPTMGTAVSGLVALFTMLDILATAALSSLGTHTYVPYIGVIPLMFASFVPWRPRTAATLGAVAATLTAVAQSPQTHPDPAEIELQLLLCIVIAAAAALLCQTRRHNARALERADTRAQLVATDRLAYMGRISAALAHEVKTPIAAAMNYISLAGSLTEEARRSIGHPTVSEADLQGVISELSDALRGAMDGSQRAAKVVLSMREQGGPQFDGASSKFTVASRIHRMLLLFKSRMRTSGIKTHVDGDATIQGNAQQFDQVLINLVRNAMDSMESSNVGDTLRIEIESTRTVVVVRVRDNGPGIAAHLRETIFEEGFTTKPPSNGLGLGLWLSQNMVASGFDGDLLLAPTHGRGACFECRFPTKKARAPR